MRRTQLPSIAPKAWDAVPRAASGSRSGWDQLESRLFARSGRFAPPKADDCAVLGSVKLENRAGFGRVGYMQRQQTRWVVTGTAVAILAFASLAGPLSFGWNPHGVALLGLWTTVFVLLTLIPLSIASALLRSELWGVEPVVNRTLVYTLLAAILIGLYVSVVAAAGALFQRSLYPLLAAAVVAVLFQPVHIGLRRGVNTLLYGSRDDPYRVMSELNERPEMCVPRMQACR
jgi:hypothetical protein